MAKKAIIVGATGLIGKELVKVLLESDLYEEVKVLVRKSVHINHTKLSEYIVDFENLSIYKI